MSRKKNQFEYVRKPFETRIPGKPSETHEKYCGLCITMLMSDAWANLSGTAQNLYIFMRLQYDGSSLEFSFNRALWLKTYKLFTSPNAFYKYRDELITQGFIKVLESGKNTRTKAIYQFSDEWQKVKGRTPKRDLKKANEARKKKQEQEQ